MALQEERWWGMSKEAMKLALDKAFRLGQRYWSWAHSEYSSHWKKADAAKAEFEQLVEDTLSTPATDAVYVAGLRASISILSHLVDQQRQLLVEVEDVCGRDGHGGRLEDGESDLIDRVRLQIAAITPPAAPVQEPLTWHEGSPPFPQDQEWFIAETIYGDRVVLRSLDEGREHKGNYAFKTADQTYMKQEIVKRWMQFPDCEYLPPAAQRQWVGLTLEEILETYRGPDGSDYVEYARAIEAKLKEKNT